MYELQNVVTDVDFNIIQQELAGFLRDFSFFNSNFSKSPFVKKGYRKIEFNSMQFETFITELHYIHSLCLKVSNYIDPFCDGCIISSCPVAGCKACEDCRKNGGLQK